jgi:hypothetical protein
MKKWHLKKKKLMINFGSLIIDKISLVSNKMLTFIDCRLCVIKQVHNEFMGGFDVIMTCDFWQAPLVQNSWIF